MTEEISFQPGSAAGSRASPSGALMSAAALVETALTTSGLLSAVMCEPSVAPQA